MSLISLTPVAGRIAEIRSALGSRNQVQQSQGFGRHLDAAVSGAAPATAVSVDQAARGVGVPAAALAALTRGATNAAPDIIRAAPAPADPVVGAEPIAETNTVASSTPYADLFNAAGARHGVDPILLASVAEVESGFDPGAVSSAGAGGLMQFMPATATEMGVERFDPASAVDGAARYLARDLERFGRLDLAIAAYNAGPGAVERHGGIPPFNETQNYVRKVLTAMENHR